jgi:phage terminase large subunit-like protein
LRSDAHFSRRSLANRITNNGGEMVENTLRMVDPSVPYSGVWASRGKVARAEPISALYEQGRVHHVGPFPRLEDQMCASRWPSTARRWGIRRTVSMHWYGR